MWYAILVMLVADIGGLLLIYVVLRDRVRRVTNADSQIAQIRDEVSRLLVELNQTTDRNIALLEDRIASLNGELAAADKKIGLIRREIEKHDVGTRVYSRLAEGRKPALPGARSAASASPYPADSASPYPADSASPSLSVELSDALPERTKAPDLRQRVMMLHGAGFSPSLISSRVGAPLGEVELIISLEQRKDIREPG